MHESKGMSEQIFSVKAKSKDFLSLFFFLASSFSCHPFIFEIFTKKKFLCHIFSLSHSRDHGRLV